MSDQTFSQRMGLAPLPAPLKFDEISKGLRNDLWRSMFLSMQNSRADKDPYGRFEDERDGYYVVYPWFNIISSYLYKFYHEPIDEIGGVYSHQANRIKRVILHGKYNDVFDLVTHVMQQPQCPTGLSEEFDNALKTNLAPYRVMEGNFIAPVSSEEAGAALARAFEKTRTSEFEGAYEHLRSAAESLNPSQVDYLGCARESIHAVESVVRKIDPKSSTTFKTALKSLKNHIEIHPALEQGVIRLYGYSSDEEGVRHAMIDPPAKVEFAEALFMLGACASFVTYLITKARDAGLLDSSEQ